MKITLTPTDDFDKALASNREYGTEFILTQGTYKTRGNWYYSDYHTLAAGCKIIGNDSILMLDPTSSVKSINGVARKNRDLNVLWTKENASVENLTIDGNESLFTNIDPSKTWFVTSGLRSSGKLTANNVTVQNIRGTLNGVGTPIKEIESFGISTIGTDGGTVITNCTVQKCPANSYISSFSVGHFGSFVTKSFITGCKINVESHNWFGFAVNCNTHISNCEIINGPRLAIYNDTDIAENCVVENCKFNNVDKLISLIIPPGMSNYKRNIKIKNCTVGFSPGPTRHFVELWDKNVDVGTIKRQLGPILLQNIVVTHDPTTKLYVAVVGSDIRPIIVIDCTLPNGLENMAGNMLSIF